MFKENKHENEDQKVNEQLAKKADHLMDEEEEMDSEEESPEENLHHRLALALQKILPNIAATPPKQYSYKDWCKYLRLINMPDKREQAAENLDPEGHKKTNDPKKEDRGTDWLAENSPLMSRLTESEWLVKHICQRLEESLREQKEEKKKGGKQNGAAGSQGRRSRRSRTGRRPSGCAR